jgi:deoxyribose-phosphate aldolase
MTVMSTVPIVAGFPSWQDWAMTASDQMAAPGSAGPLGRAEVAAMIDHTLLVPEATPDQVRELCLEAGRFGVAAVCVSPNMLPLGTDWLAKGILTACVVGFPSGAHHSAVKVTEAAQARANGADEVDMVINLALAKSGAWGGVRADIEAVREAAPRPAVLKVIIESGLLTDEEIVKACEASVAAGADFVKTSTGFHATAGGATVEAVRLMRSTVGPDLGVKASGGIRTAEKALAMIEAGANRIGTSSTEKILSGLPD